MSRRSLGVAAASTASSRRPWRSAASSMAPRAVPLGPTGPTAPPARVWATTAPTACSAGPRAATSRTSAPGPVATRSSRRRAPRQAGRGMAWRPRSTTPGSAPRATARSRRTGECAACEPFVRVWRCSGGRASARAGDGPTTGSVVTLRVCPRRCRTSHRGTARSTSPHAGAARAMGRIGRCPETGWKSSRRTMVGTSTLHAWALEAFSARSSATMAWSRGRRSSSLSSAAG
mmetsp:Transcript_47566/g.136786  ORF Transcript_47566/g.136786 Transcript_47566/m.136786 type:complete len:232 (+) Transcript_47566:1057-1752(+)